MRFGWVFLMGVGCATAPIDRFDEVPMHATEARARPEAAPATSPTPAAAVQGHWAPIDPDVVPEGAARRGWLLATDTHRQLTEYAPESGLNCTNCHVGGGATEKAAPWVGVTTRYPRYRSRSGKVDDLGDRINGCMERSMNGRPLPKDSEAMADFIAYMSWLSEGVADGEAVPNGFATLTPPEPPDPERGRQVFAERCASCHGEGGQGLMGPDDVTLFPAVAGPRSYNVGAGLARLNTTAAFIKWNMPQGQGGTLSDQEAYDVARYVAYLDRPDFPGKAADWPKGDKPSDARY